jgi:G3E family GTPase
LINLLNAERKGLFLKCHKIQPLAKMTFISEIIQLNEAAHENDYRAMGIAWAASARQKCLLLNIKSGNGVKKEILAEKYPAKRRNTTVLSSTTTISKKLRCYFNSNLIQRRLDPKKAPLCCTRPILHGAMPGI